MAKAYGLQGAAVEKYRTIVQHRPHDKKSGAQKRYVDHGNSVLFFVVAVSCFLRGANQPSVCFDERSFAFNSKDRGLAAEKVHQWPDDQSNRCQEPRI